MGQAGPHPGVWLCDFIYAKCGPQKMEPSRCAASASLFVIRAGLDQRHRHVSFLLNRFRSAQHGWLFFFLKMPSHEASRVGPVQPSPRNQVKHAGGGNGDVVPKPLFSTTAVWSDHEGRSQNGFGGGKRRVRAELCVGRLTLASSLVSQVKEMAL